MFTKACISLRQALEKSSDVDFNRWLCISWPFWPFCSVLEQRLMPLSFKITALPLFTLFLTLSGEGTSRTLQYNPLQYSNYTNYNTFSSWLLRVTTKTVSMTNTFRGRSKGVFPQFCFFLNCQCLVLMKVNGPL